MGEGGLRRTYKGLKRGLITGVILGALSGSVYQNIDHAYKAALESLGYESKAKIEAVESLKEDLPKEVYESRKEEYQGIVSDINKRLSTYKKASSPEKKKIALNDSKNLKRTAKNIHILPKDLSDLDPSGPIGKGAAYGGGIGGLGALGLAARRRIKRKKKIRDRLEGGDK